VFEGVERHSSDLIHILVYHLGPFVLVAVLLYTAIFLMTKLAKRSNKRGKRKLPKVTGLNRAQRREARATKKRQRHH